MGGKIVVLISGGGNLQSLIDACAASQIDGQISAVISNRPNVKGLERAHSAGIPQRVIDHTSFADRHWFERALTDAIEHHAPDLIVLAGFMRVLTAEFVNQYLGKLINIHPSLLPKFTGLHTHQRAPRCAGNPPWRQRSFCYRRARRWADHHTRPRCNRRPR